MRIQCNSCRETYTIDDGLLGDQPIGAQCPFCGDVQVVDPRAAQSGGAFAPSSAPLGTGSLPGTGSLDLGSGFDLSDPGLSTSRAEEALGFGADPVPNRGAPAQPSGSFEGFGSGAIERHAYDPPMPSGGTGGLDDYVGNQPTEVPFSVGPTPRSGPSTGGFDAPASDVVCGECGTPLLDEFDKVIGLCELHQQNQQQEPEGEVSLPTSSGGGNAWHARLPDGTILGPLGLEDMRDRIREGAVPLSAQFSNNGREFMPIAAFRELSYLASLGVAGAAPARSSPRPRRNLDFGRILTPVLGGLVLAGIALLAWQQRKDLAELYQRATAADEPSGPTRANPLRRFLATWRLAHPDVSGSAREHIEAADAYHVEDTWAGYSKAERAYQRALLLDENDPVAIAGYVENMALWRFPLASREETEVARNAIEYAIELDPRSAPVRRAAGALAWASGDLNGCRAGADAALELERTDARSRLVLAGCYLEGNVNLAIQEARAAREARPALARAVPVLAAGYRRAGRFKTAFEVLDERIGKEPRNGTLQLEYGRLEAALGRDERARERFRKATRLEGDVQAAWLELGLSEDRRGQARTAAAAFAKAAGAGPVSGRRGAELMTAWARSELSLGREQRAIQRSEQALDLVPKYVGAMLTLAEAHLQAGSATTAEAFARRALKERENEPAGLVLAAHIAEELGKGEVALRHLRNASGVDPKDSRLVGLLAAQYLAQEQTPQAYATMRKAADIDPARAGTVARPGGLELPVVAMRAAVKRFERSARDPVNASVAWSSAALLHHFMGESTSAKRAVDRALAADDANVQALLLKAQSELDRGSPAQAKKAASKVLLVEKGSPLGHLMLARSLVAMKEPKEAREQYEVALRANPGLLAAEIGLAAVSLSDEEADHTAAWKTLQRAYAIEPDLLFLREVLFAHDPGRLN